jgi:hypothetical protein
MTEQQKTRLYSVTIHAWRMRDGQSEVHMQSVVALLGQDVDIAEVANAQAHQVYPSGEDWKDQKAIWTEIPSDSQVGPFRLRWHAELVDSDTTAGAES